MRAAAILAELDRQGFTIRASGGSLKVSPFSNLPPALSQAIRAEKAALLRVLTETEEGNEPPPLDVPFPAEHPAPDPPFADDTAACEDPDAPLVAYPDDPAALLAFLRSQGIQPVRGFVPGIGERLWVDNVTFPPPDPYLPPDLYLILRRHKPALLALLRAEKREGQP